MQLYNSKENQNSKLFKRLITWTIVCVFSFITIFNFSETAHAGLVSFMSSLILGAEQASASSKSTGRYPNSQNISLLAAAANIDPNPDKSFDTIPVDGGETLIADIAISNATSTDTGNATISTYTVRQGDTLSGVAKMFGVSVNTVLWANDLTGKSTLKAGQVLIILPISGIKHVIKSGDTIKGIALKYNADVDDILNYNDLTSSSKLIIGQTILIPNAEVSTPQPQNNTKLPSSTLIEGSNWSSLPGYFIRPVLGGVKSQGLHGHNGIDIAAPVGTPLRASASGIVIIAKMNGGWNGGYGNYIVISHPNGTQTLYSHLSKGIVTVGQSVGQGQTIGYIGMTGLTTGPHVHFEIRGAKNTF